MRMIKNVPANAKKIGKYLMKISWKKCHTWNKHISVNFAGGTVFTHIFFQAFVSNNIANFFQRIIQQIWLGEGQNSNVETVTLFFYKNQ